ncbi:MAG: hypothetical protein K9N23_22275 [Akkermansiaceae bacterium]|nr:hypothetical protein [Akkermansiaceae bacterium]
MSIRPEGIAGWRSVVRAACVAGACAGLVACGKPGGKAADPAAAGRSVVVASLTGGISEAELSAMRWEDIAPTVEVCFKNGLTAQVLVVAAPLTQPPVVYLRGLLEFSREHPEQALAEWAKLDPAGIPADHLYAPWRLSAAGGGENRYAAPLAAAVKEGRASALVEARFHGSLGAYRDALSAYLRSDAAAWSPHDVALFRRMRQHAGCARDTAVLVAGALKGGRVPKSLLKDLAVIITEPLVPDKESIAAALKADPALAKAATVGVARLLALRQAFAANRFREVVDMNRATEPLEAADETVLLTFLAAAKIKDQPMTDRWGQELRRRKPSQDINQWITQIRTEPR